MLALPGGRRGWNRPRPPSARARPGVTHLSLSQPDRPKLVGRGWSEFGRAQAGTSRAHRFANVLDPAALRSEVAHPTPSPERLVFVSVVWQGRTGGKGGERGKWGQTVQQALIRRRAHWSKRHAGGQQRRCRPTTDQALSVVVLGHSFERPTRRRIATPCSPWLLEMSPAPRVSTTSANIVEGVVIASTSPVCPKGGFVYIEPTCRRHAPSSRGRWSRPQGGVSRH